MSANEVKPEDGQKGMEPKVPKNARDLIWDTFERVLGLVWKILSHKTNLQFDTLSHLISMLSPLPITTKHPIKTKVTAEQNIGTWLNETFKDPARMKSAISKIAFRGVAPSGIVSVAPNQSQPDMWVGLHQLCYGQHAKHGCYLVEVYYNQFASCQCQAMASYNLNLMANLVSHCN